MHGRFEHVSGFEKSKLVADHEEILPSIGDLKCEYFHKSL